MCVYTEKEMLIALYRLALESSSVGVMLPRHLLKVISRASIEDITSYTDVREQHTLCSVTNAIKCATDYKEFMEWARQLGLEDFLWRTINKYLK